MHFGGIVISADAQIGENLTIRPNTVIGGNDRGAPIIGNNVNIGVNAVVLGNIKVGNNVKIGAGCAVVHDVPDNAVVVGNPGRVIKFVEVDN